MERDIILVPTDFTPVADCAIDHAIEIARLFNHKICMLHVINKKESQEQRDKLATKIRKIALSNSERSGISFSTVIEEGSIFDEINNTAKKLNAEFIIMGIHGKKGVQHILGSYAYKVVSSSEVPVLVVKKKHHHVGYKNIVIPIDFSYESSQKINTAIKFAKYFGSTIHVIGVLDSSSSVYKIKKEALLKNVHDYIEEAGVNSITEVLIKPGSEVQNEVLGYAEKIDADLIMIVAEKIDTFTELLGRNVAEQIIDKAEIPVLTIIPNEEYDKDGDNFLSSFFDPLGLIDKP
jgi:nucleotide-binding universal stress UspA family protein